MRQPYSNSSSHSKKNTKAFTFLGRIIRPKPPPGKSPGLLESGPSFNLSAQLIAFGLARYESTRGALGKKAPRNGTSWYLWYFREENLPIMVILKSKVLVSGVFCKKENKLLVDPWASRFSKAAIELVFGAFSCCFFIFNISSTLSSSGHMALLTPARIHWFSKSTTKVPHDPKQLPLI